VFTSSFGANDAMLKCGQQFQESRELQRSFLDYPVTIYRHDKLLSIPNKNKTNIATMTNKETEQ
jgi:hypothetical protein